MSWYSLRMDGAVLDRTGDRFVNLMQGGPSMEEVLFRMLRRVEESLDATAGVLPNGLRAALVAQLAIGQWDCWNSFRAFERDEGRPYPALTVLLRSTRSSGNSSPGPSTPPASPGLPPTS